MRTAHFITITRTDGYKLHLNTAQIIYVMPDIIGDGTKRTEIVTTQGAFMINKPIADVLAIIEGSKAGEL